jgi:hypothetical protein
MTIKFRYETTATVTEIKHSGFYRRRRYYPHGIVGKIHIISPVYSFQDLPINLVHQQTTTLWVGKKSECQFDAASATSESFSFLI